MSTTIHGNIIQFEMTERQSKSLAKARSRHGRTAIAIVDEILRIALNSLAQEEERIEMMRPTWKRTADAALTDMREAWPADYNQIVAFIDAGEVIKAIGAIRKASGLGLREAKSWTDSIVNYYDGRTAFVAGEGPK